MERKNHKQKIMLGNVYGWKWMVVEKATGGDLFSSLFLFLSKSSFPWAATASLCCLQSRAGPSTRTRRTSRSRRMSDEGQNGWTCYRAKPNSNRIVNWERESPKSQPKEPGGGGGQWSRPWGNNAQRTKAGITSCSVYEAPTIPESYGRVLEFMFEAKCSDWTSK